MIQKHDQHNEQGNSVQILNDNKFTMNAISSPRTQQNKGKKYQYIGFNLLAAFSSVVISQLLISNTLAKRIFSNIYDKRYLGQLFNPNAQDKKIWINRQIKQLIKTMIRYNSIFFCTKTLLDQYYSQTLKTNQAYYQSNSSLYYKIGALVGLIGYTVTIPISEFQAIKAINKIPSSFIVGTDKPKYYMEILKNTWGQFLSVQSFRKMMNNFSFTSLGGVIIYRTIYFGGYEKMKSKYDHPLNEYVLAPIGCSSLGLITSPIDQIKYLQMTSHKDKPFYQIMVEKGRDVWNLSGQKVYTSILRQSFSLSLYVAGQNLCRTLINMKNSSQ